MIINLVDVNDSLPVRYKCKVSIEDYSKELHFFNSKFGTACQERVSFFRPFFHALRRMVIVNIALTVPIFIAFVSNQQVFDSSSVSTYYLFIL